MNPVCPGFMPHHVKPNRCRRCFRDTHDHDVNVSTSFTIPLPRRRRESVAITESSKAVEEAPNDDRVSATFTITETSSLGRRTRQRSASTSSWFQEKSEVVQKEKIDALFRNSDDSKVPSNKEEDQEENKTTLRHRSQTSEDVRKRDEKPTTSDREGNATLKQTNVINKTGISDRYVRTKEKDTKLSSNAKPSTPSGGADGLPETKAKFSVRETKEAPNTDPSKSVFTKPSEVKLKSVKLSRPTDTVETPPKIPPKVTDFKSNLRSMADLKPVEKKPLADDSTRNKSTDGGSTDAKLTEKKSVTSRFLDSRWREPKTNDNKFGTANKIQETSKIETRPKDSKISAAASKFEPVSLRSVQLRDIKSQENSKLTGAKSLETKAPETSVDAKKVEAKPVLSRFSTFKKEETKPALTKTAVVAPKVTPKSSSSSSSSEEESESDESSSPPPSKPTPKSSSATTEKTLSKDSPSSPEVAFVVKLKPAIPPAAAVQDEKIKVKELEKLLKQQETKTTDLQKTLGNTKEDLKKSEDARSKLEKEKLDLQKKRQQLLDKDKEALEKTAAELSKMRSKLGEMQTSHDQAREENRKLKQDIEKSKKDLEKSKQEFDRSKQEVEKTRLDLEKAKQEAKRKDQQPIQQISQDSKSKQTIDQLKQKLQQTEALCQELVEENEDIKKEVRDLEQELEELHDNFREDQASEFRGLKKELETATKNCRVLQFKLRKAEKRCEQLELDRHSLEDKVREFQSSVRRDVDKDRAKELENELKMSRKLTSALNEEISSLKDELQSSQAENEVLQRQQKGGSRSVTPTKQSRLSPVASREGLSTPVGKDHESLTRELYDTMERENDLREQLKFSEEEAKTTRRKMSALEQENETLMLQMKKLNSLMRARTNKGEKNDDEEEEFSADNLKLQLEMQEQEMGVLRRKLEDTEKENESFQSEVKYLQEKIINQPLILAPDLPEEKLSTSDGSAYWEKKARLLEHELRETRRKMMEKEREIERLHTEVEIYRKKASRMMVRSRSLDSDLQVDLKRQLQLVEQEASLLRQKVSSLESETEKLTTENKRLNLRLSKKPPMSSSELAHLDNLELKQRNEELQRKMSDLKQELLEKTGMNDNPVAILQDYKPRRESLTSLTDNENDLIISLKKKLKNLEEEQQAQQNKCMHLEIDHNRLSREHKRLKETLSTKKKPLKAIRDSATRIELRELVNELQDEISELQVSLRGREVVQEGLEEELEKTKRELKEALQDVRSKEDRLKEELLKVKKEKDVFQKEAETQKKRASSAEEHLGQVSGQLSADQVELSKKVRQLQEEMRDSERKARAAEESLEKKTRRLRETQEKLNTITTLKDDLIRTNRLLESQKEDLTKELEDHRELVKKAESRVTELRNQMDNTDRDVTSLRKECNQLRNELEDERSRLKQAKQSGYSQESSQHSLLIKDREDLRRANNELRNRIESVQQQVTHNEEIWIEKESRLREDHKRKKEAAVKEAREKGEAALELAKEEEKILRNKVQEYSDKLEKAETSFKEAQEKIRQAASQHRKEKEALENAKDDFESRLRSEAKKRERAEREAEQTSKQKEEELLQSKDRLVQLEREQRRMQMQVEEAADAKQKAGILEKETDRLRQEYDDLTAKYEQLETEFVRAKSHLVQEKEQAETQTFCLRRDLNDITAELSTLKDTYGKKQDSWIKEKLDLQERVKDSERRLERLKTAEQERLRLKSQLDEKETLMESYRKEEKHLKEEREKLRKTLDEMSKASEVQRQAWISSISSSDGDKANAAAKELVVLRADYEGRMTIMASEIANMQKQIGQLATERDALRAKVSSVERNAEEMKTGSLKRERARHREEAEMARRKVKELRMHLDDMKEQLEDIALENKNLKLQNETDKNTSDIQTSELKSKINQLEEQKMLESARGQTRNLAKTRLELAWEKERGELQHLLSESHKFVEDLKVRVETGEKEREKEKQTLRRQLTHMREVADKDQHDNRRKMAELHSSLLDMRESQAKLRGLYDRMKREREMLITERDEWRQRLHITQEIHSKIQQLQQHVELVSSAVSEKTPNSQVAVTPEFTAALTEVKEKFAELHKMILEFKDDERVKRTISFRRAVSAQEMNQPSQQDPSQRWMQPQRVTNYPLAPPSMILRPPPRQKSLHRKSLSLDHTIGRAGSAEMLKIWESGGESVGSTPAGSLLSLRLGYESDSSFADSEYKYGGSLPEHKLPRRYLQVPGGMTTDSEIGGSSREGSIATSAESVPAAVQNQQKKATLKDKLKMLRRTKSIDVSGAGHASKEGKDNSLRSKISKVLKNPMGRSLSMDVHRQKSVPALPPKGAVPEGAPKRPSAEKPLSASKGDLSTERPLTHSKTSRTPAKTETPV